MKSSTKKFREQSLRLFDDIDVKKAAEQLSVIYGTLAAGRKQRAQKKIRHLQ